MTPEFVHFKKALFVLARWQSTNDIHNYLEKENITSELLLQDSVRLMNYCMYSIEDLNA
jgi:hypothetical protein